jgi:hypothetical protein
MRRPLIRRYTAEEEEFRRCFTFPQEEMRRFTSAPWGGGFRWFKAVNVIPIEWFRRPPGWGSIIVVKDEQERDE